MERNGSARLTNSAGEWVPDKPQQEQRCAPIEGVELQADGSLGPQEHSALATSLASDMTNAMDTMLRGGRRNVRSEYVLGKLGIPIMHIWNQTVPFWDFHRLASSLLLDVAKIPMSELFNQNCRKGSGCK